MNWYPNVNFPESMHTLAEFTASNFSTFVYGLFAVFFFFFLIAREAIK